MNELVIFDLDNTIIKGQSQKLFLGYIFKKRLITRFFYVKLMLWFVLYKLGLINNPKKVMEYSFRFLKDKDVDEFKRIINDFFEQELKHYIFEDMLEIIEEHKSKKRKTLIISNAISFIPQRVADFLGIDYSIGTELEQKNNKFTGKIKGDIIYSKKKVVAIDYFIRKNKISLNNSYGYSDHHSDLPFLQIVDNPIVVNPDSKLEEKAKKEGWPILVFNQTINNK